MLETQNTQLMNITRVQRQGNGYCIQPFIVKVVSDYRDDRITTEDSFVGLVWKCYRQEKTISFSEVYGLEPDYKEAIVFDSARVFLDTQTHVHSPSNILNNNLNSDFKNKLDDSSISKLKLQLQIIANTLKRCYRKFAFKLIICELSYQETNVNLTHNTRKLRKHNELRNYSK